MTALPDFLSSGDRARLFPILAESNKEKRVASIFLAVMTQIPVVAKEILKTVGANVGKQTKIEAFTEVVFKEGADSPCRPDGLILVTNRNKTWAALVEAKIASSKLDVDQVKKYLGLAKANGIDAVITISNQFVDRADHSPVSIPKTQLRTTKLFHWSWSWLATQCEIVAYQEEIDDPEQGFLLRQLNHFFAHKATGIERFNQMGAGWREIVKSVANNDIMSKGAPVVEEAVSDWYREERDLCLHMSSHVGLKVSACIKRNLANDPTQRLKRGISDLVETQTLKSVLRIPDCASDISICADIARRTVTVSMWLKAPTDRKSTEARANWALRMLKQDDSRLFLRAIWPGRAVPTTLDVKSLREDPTRLQARNPDLTPLGFEVLIVEELGKRFSGRKTFIEDLEKSVKDFYDLAGTHLKAWQPRPPRPVSPQLDEPPHNETSAQ